MFKRILTGWTWIRAAYLLVGVWIIVQSALESEWIGIVLGSWPAAMGLFGLACAGGQCTIRSCQVNTDVNPKQ